MKFKLKTGLFVISSLIALAGGESFGANFQELPVEMGEKIFSYLFLKDWISIGGTSRAIRTLVPEMVSLNLSEIDLNINQFRTYFESIKPTAFQEGGLFQNKHILLSHRSYRGTWIEYLPSEGLGPREDGTARLKVKTTTGSIFEYAGLALDLGHGWKDPNGLIWYLPKNKNRTNWEKADNFCKERNARLPENKDYRSLGEWFGAVYFPNGGLDESQSNYILQILPYFMGEISWSSSLQLIDSFNTASAFNAGIDGSIDDGFDLSNDFYVWCVR